MKSERENLLVMNEDIITIQENSPGEEIDFNLSDEDKKYLESDIFNKAGRKNIEVFYKDKDGKPRIRVGPFAGIIQLSNKRIHFSTKVNTKLFCMLSFLKSEDEFLYDPNTQIEIREGVNFFDVIGRFFLNHLNDLLTRGLLKKYIRKSENLRFLKGKILIKNQIRENLIDKSKFFCGYEDMTFNNLENRIVLSALNSLIPLIKFNIKSKNELRRLEIVLKDFISLVRIYPHECNLVRFNRVNQYYEDIIGLSKLILEERFIRSVYKGESRGFNFIVNMNKVYEEFITEIIKEIISLDPEFNNFEIEMQSRFNKLVKGGEIIIRPDIVIKKNDEEYPVIIDTKYKRGDVASDYYQVIAYSLALRSSKACCLIYPKDKEDKTREVPFILIRDLTSENPDEVKLFARTIDLYMEEDEDEEIEYEEYINRVKSNIKKILNEMLGSYPIYYH